MIDIESQLDQIEHYSKIPVMKPFIGANYLSAPKKILILGESQYFDHYPKNEHPKCNTGPSVWYSYTEVIPREKLDHINTRDSVKKSKHRFFINLKSILSEVLEIDEKHVLENIAFMNAFQRPANHLGVSIADLCSEKDYEVGVTTVTEVINILKPDYVIFVSKLSWDKIGTRINPDRNYKLGFTSHPNSFQWNSAKDIDNNKWKLYDLLDKEKPKKL